MGNSPLSEIECASAFMPVLAIEQDAIATGARAAFRPRVFTRENLAERFGVDPRRSIGKQLYEKGAVNQEQARLIDGEVFERRSVKLKLRLDNTIENVSEWLKHAKATGIIDQVVTEQEQGAYLIAEVTTRRFVDLARLIAVKLPHLAVLLAINDEVLYY